SEGVAPAGVGSVGLASGAGRDRRVRPAPGRGRRVRRGAGRGRRPGPAVLGSGSHPHVRADGGRRAVRSAGAGGDGRSPARVLPGPGSNVGSRGYVAVWGSPGRASTGATGVPDCPDSRVKRLTYAP